MQNLFIYSIIQKYQEKVNNFLVMMTLREIPVPIPNTEVKPKCAENTCGLPCWKDRLLPVLYKFYINSSLAQLVERSAVEQVARLKS